MSTHHEIGKGRETSPQPSVSSHEQDSLQERTVSPARPFPRPPRRPVRTKANRWMVIGAVMVALAIIASLGAIFVPGLLQRPGVKDPAYWDPILGTHSGVNKVESVSLANIMDPSSLQALVTVRYTGTDARLDVYVFTNISSAKPTEVFRLPDLVKGETKISGYQTVMTGQVDKNSTFNAGKPVSAMTVDLFREFEWSNSNRTFVQVAFPGIFPDLTRYQAEADQALVNGGHDTWKNDPQAVAQALAKQFFGWPRALTTKVLSGGGSQDVDATVQVQEAPVQGGPTLSPSAMVTLSRLQGNPHNMWVAIGVQDGTALTLTSIQPKSLVASPVKLEGQGSAFENTVGMASILDHLYTKVGQAIVTGKTGPGMGTVSYATQVSYETSFKGGPQEGIVQVQLTTPIEAGPETAVMVKVLLSPEPVVVQGPVSCPLVTQAPGYWETVLGMSTGRVGMPSCGNLKGDPSLQALVPVPSSNGQPGVFYVYDHISDAHPVQLFKLQTTSALISGVSTIITRDGDVYREFGWSGSKGTFVQVVFPGMFPNLTRGQAETDQAAVNTGQGSWKLDAVKTTQHWNLLGGTAKLVKGGGPGDLTAVVEVTYPEPGGPITTIPVTRVTLSRLEGNPNGIWEITAVGSDWLFIYTPTNGATMSSPVTVTGFGPQFEAQVGVVYILDRLYQEIQVGNNFAMLPGDGSSPPARFSLDVKYTSSLKGVTQEGLVELVHTSGASFDRGVVLVKVLIGA